MKLTNFHIAVSSFAAIAGVALAAYQAFAPSSSGQPPLNVVVSVDPPGTKETPDLAVEKTDAMPAIATEAVDLGLEATAAAALNDGSDQRYSFSSLFDGRSDTYLTVAAPDREVNILVNFKSGTARPVTAIEYVPPPGIDPHTMATTLDVMVLPEGQLEASGRAVLSFSLQPSAESQIFAVPGRAEGKAIWLRVAGGETAERIVVGDFRILSEGLAP